MTDTRILELIIDGCIDIDIIKPFNSLFPIESVFSLYMYSFKKVLFFNSSFLKNIDVRVDAISRYVFYNTKVADFGTILDHIFKRFIRDNNFEFDVLYKIIVNNNISFYILLLLFLTIILES